MPNYKPFGHSSFDLDGVIDTIPVNSTLVYLQYDVNVATGLLTMRIGSGTNYQVPTGKIFHLRGVIITQNGTVSLHYIIDGATPAAGTPIVWTMRNPAVAENSFVPLSIDFAAGQYVVWKSVSAVTNYVMMVGYETNV